MASFSQTAHAITPRGIGKISRLPSVFSLLIVLVRCSLQICFCKVVLLLRAGLVMYQKLSGRWMGRWCRCQLHLPGLLRRFIVKRINE